MPVFPMQKDGTAEIARTRNKLRHSKPREESVSSSFTQAAPPDEMSQRILLSKLFGLAGAVTIRNL